MIDDSVTGSIDGRVDTPSLESTAAIDWQLPRHPLALALSSLSPARGPRRGLLLLVLLRLLTN